MHEDDLVNDKLTPPFRDKRRACRLRDERDALNDANGLHCGSSIWCAAANLCIQNMPVAAAAEQGSSNNGAPGVRQPGACRTLKQVFEDEPGAEGKGHSWSPWCHHCGGIFHHPVCKQRHRPNGRCLLPIKRPYTKMELESGMLVCQGRCMCTASPCMSSCISPACAACLAQVAKRSKQRVQATSKKQRLLPANTQATPVRMLWGWEELMVCPALRDV